MKKDDVIKKAKEFCYSHKISEYPVRIIELCGEYGLKVYEEYMPSNISGMIVARKDPFPRYGTNQLIIVNRVDSARRRRFSAAHELAHYVLHKKEGEELFAHRSVGANSPVETEANIFASNILMPENLVRKAMTKLIEDIGDDVTPFLAIEYIANQFAVSTAAAQTRLSQLDII